MYRGTLQYIITMSMTPEEKLTKIKELEQQFLGKIDEIRKDFQLKMKELVVSVEKEKIDSLKKDLGLHQ